MWSSGGVNGGKNGGREEGSGVCGGEVKGGSGERGDRRGERRWGGWVECTRKKGGTRGKGRAVETERRGKGVRRREDGVG